MTTTPTSDTATTPAADAASTPKKTPTSLHGLTAELELPEDFGTPPTEGDAEVPSDGVVEDAGNESEPVEDVPADGDAPPAEPLPEFNADDPEVLAAYDSRFFTDGSFDKSAFEAEWFGNLKEGEAMGDSRLSEGTYAYIKHRMGIDRETADVFARGVALAAEQEVTKFYAAAGGKERYETAIAWAKQGGYTEENRKRFEVALRKGGQDAEDARDALMARFNRTRNKSERGVKEQRLPAGAPPAATPKAPITPQRDAASGAGAGVKGVGVQGFETREAAQAAFKATRRASDPVAALDSWRKRMAASSEDIQRP